jgi:hypothetical protein
MFYLALMGIFGRDISSVTFIHSKTIVGKRYYEGGKKYCRRYEVYYCHDGVFCPCCGMALRSSPNNKKNKERLRQLTLREEQDR